MPSHPFYHSMSLCLWVWLSYYA